MAADPRYEQFPAGFFDRADESDDGRFYEPDRFVTHIDDDAIAAVGALYDELDIGRRGNGRVLDLCSSWISHFTAPPPELVVLGMNDAELAANTAATASVVHDLNVDPTLPFDDASFDDAVCCVSVDYLTRPLEVFARGRPGAATRRSVRLHVLQPLLPDEGDPRLAGQPTTPPTSGSSRRTSPCAPASTDRRGDLRTPADRRGDPLYAVWASRR